MMQKEPGIIIGPITKLLGVVFNYVFSVVYNITQTNALGISIPLGLGGYGLYDDQQQQQYQKQGGKITINNTDI